MFRSRTVFVLGAGASAEVGLPVGSALLKIITELINLRYDHGRMVSGDYQISEALRILLDEGQGVERYNEHLHAAWQIADSSKQALSIDNIVDGLEDPQIELMAKLGIVRAIQQAEEDSIFFQPDNRDPRKMDMARFESSWYSDLTKLICENRRKSDLSDVFENLSFISFNYDRCIEAYLPRSISNYYGVETSEIVPLFINVKIHRPYGIAGPVDWHPTMGMRGFGAGSAENLTVASEMIRTFTEGVENPESLEDMRADLMAAERIVFLGTAFHRQNLELLKTSLPHPTRIFATASSISDHDLFVIDKELREVFSIQPTNKDAVTFAKILCNAF